MTTSSSEVVNFFDSEDKYEYHPNVVSSRWSGKDLVTTAYVLF